MSKQLQYPPENHVPHSPNQGTPPPPEKVISLDTVKTLHTEMSRALDICTKISADIHKVHSEDRRPTFHETEAIVNDIRSVLAPLATVVQKISKIIEKQDGK